MMLKEEFLAEHLPCLVYWRVEAKMETGGVSTMRR